VTALHSMNDGDATHSAVQLFVCVCFSAKRSHHTQYVLLWVRDLAS